MNTASYVSFAKPQSFVSQITGRQIYVNASSQFMISPCFTIKALRSLRKHWSEHLDELLARRNTSAPHKARSIRELLDPEVFDKCFTATDRNAFARSVGELVARLRSLRGSNARNTAEKFRKLEKGRGESKRILEALMLMWKSGLLLFPAAEMWKENWINAHSLPEIEETFFGPCADVILSMWSAIRATHRRSVFILPLTIAGLVEIGDIDANVLAAFKPFVPRRPAHIRYLMCDKLLAVQRAMYANRPQLLQTLPQSYRDVFRGEAHARRSDPEFRWAFKLGGERLTEWCNRASSYVRTLTNRVTLHEELRRLNKLLDYVIANADVPSEPISYCHRTFTPRQPYVAYLSSATRMNATQLSASLYSVRRFFDGILLADGCDEDGIPVPGYKNPISPNDTPTGAGKRGQTERSAIPIRFIRMMREIIESPDEGGNPTYAWPKTLAADYFDWVNPENGEHCRVWSPVRAYAFLLRFMVPIRTLQTQLLDSGESDSEVYRPDCGGWLKNAGPLAPPTSGEVKRTGLLRRIWDHDACRFFTGLFITTNKTADRSEMFTDCGYEIPWESEDIIKLFCDLRDWQEKYNPCTRVMTRAELHWGGGRFMVSKDLEERLEKLSFLFRDAANSFYPQEPPSDGRLKSFWTALIAELETRLAKEGVTNTDGSSIELVTSWRRGAPKSVVFDLHSLRVTGLTALIGAGVPIHILSEFVAGHATVLMTLYYFKPGAAKVTEALDEAWQRVAEAEARDFARYLKDQPIELIHDIAVYNSEEGLRSAVSTQSALWASFPDGICPNSGTLCNEGGPLLQKQKNLHIPVTGGPRNCALCRFFVTGPAFLGGLVAKFNTTAANIREKCLLLKEKEEERRRMVAKYLSSTSDLEASERRRRFELVEEAIQGLEREVDILSQTWTAQLALIKRTEGIIRRKREKVGDTTQLQALVLNGSVSDFHSSLRECSEYDLWDRICHSTVFFPNVDARLPSIRRARLFDAMLGHVGLPATFAMLDDAQLIEVGNAWSAFLRVRLGDSVVNDLLAGRSTIQELGIEQELLGLVEESLSAEVSISARVIDAKGTRRLVGTVPGGKQSYD